MELDVFEFILSHLQNKRRIGHKNQTPLLILAYSLCFPFAEFVNLFRVIAFYPAGFVHRNRLETAFGSIFVFKPVLDYLKLQLPPQPIIFRPLNWLVNSCATPSSIN